MCTHACTGTSAGTLHRVRGLRARPFSITPPCKQPHSVFGGFLDLYLLIMDRSFKWWKLTYFSANFQRPAGGLWPELPLGHAGGAAEEAADNHGLRRPTLRLWPGGGGGGATGHRRGPGRDPPARRGGGSYLPRLLRRPRPQRALSGTVRLAQGQVARVQGQVGGVHSRVPVQERRHIPGNVRVRYWGCFCCCWQMSPRLLFIYLCLLFFFNSLVLIVVVFVLF